MTRIRQLRASVFVNALGFLTWNLSGGLTNGQNVECSEKAYVQADTQDVFTYKYRGLRHHTWCFSTDPGYVITLNCLDVQMMKFTGFCRDTLNVTTTGNVRDGRVFCDPFQVKGSSVVMKLFSLDGNGNFKCRIKSTPANQCRCGYSGDYGMKIVGGTPARPHEFTSMAAMLNARSGDWTCGATLIHERLAVTAAQCVVDGNNNVYNARNYRLIVGEHKKTGSSDSQYLYRIRRFVPYPGYEGGQVISGDISLIETEITMWFDRNVGPACLPYKFSNYLYNAQVIVADMYTDCMSVVKLNSIVQLDNLELDIIRTNQICKLRGNNGSKENIFGWGWGHTEFGGPGSDVLRKGTVTIQEPSKCENLPAYQDRGYDRNTMICTYQEGVDSCQEDTGGPVYYRDPRTGLLFLLGVTSTGASCGEKYPSVDTMVYSYINWIQSTYPSAEFCRIA